MYVKYVKYTKFFNIFYSKRLISYLLVIGILLKLHWTRMSETRPV